MYLYFETVLCRGGETESVRGTTRQNRRAEGERQRERKRGRE